ncbi:YciI family protein [Kribbella sp. C-35]|uniref:YciI family protein n=1 Tax=Kribbella sp. C-35 TaxID=2789276 RepID=UPI00397D727C
MKYMLLIFGDEAEWMAMSAEEQEKIDSAHREFTARAGAAVLASGQLEASTTATTLRSGDAGQVSITDGPFLEAKEGIGGFYVLEAENLDQVIKLASGLREVHAGHSGVEIRPLVNHG